MTGRASAAKDILGVWLGDPHSGADHGLTLPKLAKNDRQAWLAEVFQDITKRIRAEARGKRLHVHLGGDMVHLPGDDDARELAETLFRPIVAMADEAAAVAGTDYHVGEDGSDDRSIYRGLGIPRANIRVGTAYLTLGGREIVWAHHGPRTGKRPHTELDGLDRTAEDAYRRSLEWGEPAPALIVGHHVHQANGCIYRRGIWVATCPALALSDSYAAKVAFNSRPTIGALVYYPGPNKPDIWPYAIPRRFVSA